ncbi:type 4a pilus biogenesis protein PilO [Kineococcus sp. SYSU DK002]|uniref:type 4a pilus biogenesis protein PilO n=1 Tax=Kineococcus sp. SYSU DK002 TaxID=3383123 RepID=UPI003D7D4DD9
MTRSPNTVWIGGAGVLAVLVLIASYFLVIAPQRAEAADLATQAAQVAQQNEQIALKTEQLEADFATLDERKAELAAITATLPAEAEVPQLLRQFTASAASAGVTLTSVTPGTPALHGGAEATADTTASGPTVVDIPVTIGIQGSFAATELFVKQIQTDLDRFLLLDDVTLSTGATTAGTGLTTQIEGVIYVVRDQTTTDTTSGDAS